MIVQKSGVQYGQTNTYTGGSTKFYLYQWSQENSQENAIDGVLTNGTLGQSEQYNLTTETYSSANTSITLTQTYWKNIGMTASNFKTVRTRNIQNDANIYFNLFMNKQYLVASRSTMVRKQ